MEVPRPPAWLRPALRRDRPGAPRRCRGSPPASPMAMVRPCCSTWMRSQSAKTSDMRCSISRMPQTELAPDAAGPPASGPRIRHRSARRPARPSAGIAARMAMARAMPTRRSSPKGRVSTLRCARAAEAEPIQHLHRPPPRPGAAEPGGHARRPRHSPARSVRRTAARSGRFAPARARLRSWGGQRPISWPPRCTLPLSAS